VRVVVVVVVVVRMMREVAVVALRASVTLCKGWLRHCATNRRIPGSIPGHWRFFPGHQTVPCALGSTQPLKMSTRIFLGVKTAGA